MTRNEKRIQKRWYRAQIKLFKDGYLLKRHVRFSSVIQARNLSSRLNKKEDL